MFSPKDIEQMAALEIDPRQVEEQLRFFESGFSFLNVLAPAVVGRGVHLLDDQEQEELLMRYEGWGGSRTKFVPASGAATRMFKELYQALSLLEQNPQAPLSGDAAQFFDSLRDFAFYPLLASDPHCTLSDRKSILQTLLLDQGLCYGSLPKGLLAFHRYDSVVRTAFEEHLVEAALYAKDGRGVAKIHFTVSPEHRPRFEELTAQSLRSYEKRFGVKYKITFSEQKPYTDTIAADLQNRAFRQKDGTLLFRPGGHGALLENLNELHDDVVFIKNIDNVVREEQLADTIRWKKILCGKLLQLRAYILNMLNQLEQNDSPIKVKEAALFLEKYFSVTLPQTKEEEYAATIRTLLDRPLRVCGVVKNSGEPGGGPFIVRDANGMTSLQILETAQLPPADATALLAASTHFNPVDIVCSYKDYKGSAYPLRLHSDPATGFISQKSKDGDAIKVLELPGLWNGAMSRWNTHFIEVPAHTFNPVKTATDLLRPAHLKKF
ncbi:MAG: DUF4301 family protein [Bacteroidales bacterium]|nr:DUF4301 family protein [Bacteroidales bacterium]